MHAHDQQRTFRIITTAEATARNIRLIVEKIITSHTDIAYHVEHNAEGTLLHQGFSELISVEFACEVHSITPECTVIGKMFGGHYLPNRVTSVSVHQSKTPDFFAAMKSKIINLRLFITAWIWRLLI